MYMSEAQDPSHTVAKSNVTRLQLGDKQIHLIGTAHISQSSVEEVRRVISELRPDTVCVELDQNRYEALTQDNRFEKLDIEKIVAEDRALSVLAALTLTAFQRRMGKKLGVTPGAELLAAVQSAEAVGAKLVLADRDVQATLKRSWASLSGWERANMSFVMVSSFFVSHELSAEQLEAMKDKDTIGELMHEVARAMPSLQLPLIEERDRYLMSMIQEAEGKVIVGVVGAAHVSGMVQELGKSVDRQALCELPTPTVGDKVRPWFVPAIALGTVLLVAPSVEPARLIDFALAWCLPIAAATAVGALLAGAGPFTLLAAMVTAPFLRLNPLRRKNGLAVRIEARWRKPSLEQRRDVKEAMLSLSGMRRNAFTRVLLVALGIELGGRIGALVGLVLVMLKAWRG
jgi:pheromone shutdown-related protein TraB